MLLLIFQLILWLWFFGCIVTYRIGPFYLVEGMGMKSAEFFMCLLYSTGIVLRVLFPAFGNWYTLAVLVFWLIIQFFCHWYYTIFGATKEKIQGYNECFHGTVRIIPQREDLLVPDFYHIVLHILITANIILLCISLFPESCVK